MKPGTWPAALALLAFAGIASAQAPEGALQTDRTPRDVEFGVRARHAMGLERRVEMYQWRADGAGPGFTRTWSARPIDSEGFESGHENPGDFPMRSQRWLARRITIDGKPLDTQVVAELGRWQPMRPSFSALPGHMSATFQPEGDGLGSAENPLAPDIGDLRITWSELVLPPLHDRLLLRDGRWHLTADTPSPATATAAVDEQAGGSQWPAWSWWLALLALAIAGTVLLRRRSRR